MSANAIDCAYSSEGAGPPILMIHGVGARREVWSGLIERLKPGYRCISYDLRGHGQSPKPAVPFALEDLVADLEALRAGLGIEKAHVVGHSLGGMVAPAYARRHPGRTLSVTLLSTAAGRSEADRARAGAVVAAMEEKGMSAVLGMLAERWFSPEFARSRPGAVDARLRQAAETDPAVYLQCFRIYAEAEMAPWLPEVAAPALLVTGEEDAGCSPRLNRIMSETLPDARLAVLAGLRHSILIEAPGRVAEPVLAFLRSLAP